MTCMYHINIQNVALSSKHFMNYFHTGSATVNQWSSISDNPATISIGIRINKPVPLFYLFPDLSNTRERDCFQLSLSSVTPAMRRKTTLASGKISGRLHHIFIGGGGGSIMGSPSPLPPRTLLISSLVSANSAKNWLDFLKLRVFIFFFFYCKY